MTVTRTGPDLEKYFEDRVEYFTSISNVEKLVADELNLLIQKNLDTFEEKARFINSESNQFERQHTGFFAIAISFIIAGLLNVIPATTDTEATKFLFVASLTLAVLAATLLFLEFIIVRRFQNKWKQNNQEIITYITTGNWKNPIQLFRWISNHQSESKIAQQSSSWVVQLEIVLQFWRRRNSGKPGADWALDVPPDTPLYEYPIK